MSKHRAHIPGLKDSSLTVEQFRKLTGVNIHKSPLPPTRKRSGDAPQLATMLQRLDALKIPYQREYIFHPERNWRFDIALVEHKVAIEYEGIVSQKSRHTTITGFTEDSVKYNEATLLGWKVLRYTAVTFDMMIPQLEKLIQLEI